MNSRIASLAVGAVLASSSIARSEEPKPLELELVTIRHPAINNMVAGEFLMPKGWQFQGGLKNYHWAWHQVCLESTVSNPKTLEQVAALPWSHCVWHTAHANPTPRLMLDRAGLLTLEPMTPREVIEKITLDQVRKGLNARVVAHDDQPEIAKLFGDSMPGVSVKAGRTRVSYQIDGKPVEEDFYQVLYYVPANVGAGNTTFWGPVVPPFSLRAAKGELDDATPRLLAIQHSFWVNPKWADEIAHVQALFYQRVTNGTINEAILSMRIAANNDAIRTMIAQEHAYRNCVNDRVARNFSNYLRGVQEFRGASGSYVLPSTHSHAWANGVGGFLMSNDPNFNPNVSGRTTGWTQLKPVR